MSNQEVIDKIIELKVIGLKEQEFEVCAHLRNIENSFTKSKHAKVHLEPTKENLKLELTKMFKYFSKYKLIDRNGQSIYNNKSSVIRDIKLILLLDEL